jgi:hypothetical protein
MTSSSLYNHVFVEGDVNGDGRADFHINIAQLHALTSDDFGL